jgi:hypothetical protein
LPLLGTLEHLKRERAMRTWSRRGLVAALLLGLFHFLVGAGSPQTLALAADGLLRFGLTDSAAAALTAGVDLPTIELVRAGEPSRMRPLREAVWDVAKTASGELPSVPDVGAVRKINQLYDVAIELSEEMGGDGVAALQVERDSVLLSNLRRKVESGLASDALQLLSGLIGGIKATPDTLEVIGRCVEDGGRQLTASAAQTAARVRQTDLELEECRRDLRLLNEQLTDLREVTNAFRSSTLFDGGLDPGELQQLGRPFGIGEASADLAEASHCLCDAILEGGESPEVERLAKVARIAAVRLADADLIREVQEQVIGPLWDARLEPELRRLRRSSILSREGDNQGLVRDARETVMQIVTAQPSATNQVREVMVIAVGAAIRQIHQDADDVAWESTAGQEFVQGLEADLAALEPFLPWGGVEGAADAIRQYAKCRLAVAQTGQQGAVPSSAVLNAALDREIQRSLVLPESEVEEWQIGEGIYSLRLGLIGQYRSHLIELIETAPAARIAQHIRALRDALGPNTRLLDGPLATAEAHVDAMRLDVNGQLLEELLGAMRASAGEASGLQMVRASLLRLARDSRTSGLALEVAAALLRESGASLVDRRELCEEVFMAASDLGLEGMQAPLCAFLQALGEDGDRGLLLRVLGPLLEVTESLHFESCLEAQPGLQGKLVSALGASVRTLLQPYMAPLLQSLESGAAPGTAALELAKRNAEALDAQEHLAALNELTVYLAGLEMIRAACQDSDNSLVMLARAGARGETVWALQMPLTLEYLRALATRVPVDRRGLIRGLSFVYADPGNGIMVESLTASRGYRDHWRGVLTTPDIGWKTTGEIPLIGCGEADVLRILEAIGAAVLPSMRESLRLPARDEYGAMALDPGFLTDGLRDWVDQSAPSQEGDCWQPKAYRRPISSSFRFVIQTIPPLMRQFQ